MNPAVELRHLRYFVAVAEELHFGRAAERLVIAQPSLSQQIRRLEAMLGTDLLVRTSRTVELTAAGEALLDRSRRLLEQSDANLEEAARIGRGELGRLDIGLISSAIPLGVAGRIRAFRAEYPQVEVKMHEGFSSQFVRRVLEHDIDLAVVRDMDPHPGVTVMPLAEEQFVVVVPADHPLAGRASVHASDLRDDPLVIYPSTAGERAYARNLEPMRAAGFEPRVVQEASHWLTIIHLVGAGLGITVAPESATRSAPPNVRVLPLTGTDATSEVQLIRREGDHRAVVENFMRLPNAVG